MIEKQRLSYPEQFPSAEALQLHVTLQWKGCVGFLENVTLRQTLGWGVKGGHGLHRETPP